jgi:hypothetical protein
MELSSAVQQYLIGLKEEAPRQRVEFDLPVLARLQEFLEGEPGLEQAEAIRPGDLKDYVNHWLRSADDVTPEAAQDMITAIVDFAVWLDRQFCSLPMPSPSGQRPRSDATPTSSRQPIAPSLIPLREGLPRAVRAAALLSRHVHREDLEESIPVEEMPEGSPLGTLSAGISRVMRPLEIDYDRAEEDTYSVVEVSERSVALLSPAREQLAEGPAAPVAVPASAARLLRVGDVVRAEIAPTGAGWEILNVDTVIPGGLDDRP